MRASARLARAAPRPRGAQRLVAAVAKARRQRIFCGRRAAPLVVAGAVMAATSEGSIVRSARAIVLLGGAAVLSVSLAFLEVGLSEDRERQGRFGRPSDATATSRSASAVGALLQVTVSASPPSRGPARTSALHELIAAAPARPGDRESLTVRPVPLPLRLRPRGRLAPHHAHEPQGLHRDVRQRATTATSPSASPRCRRRASGSPACGSSGSTTSTSTSREIVAPPQRRRHRRRS